MGTISFDNGVVRYSDAISVDNVLLRIAVEQQNIVLLPKCLVIPPPDL